MNKFINQSNQILSFALIVLLLQACGTGKRSISQPEIAPQPSIEHLLKQAQQAPLELKSPLLVQVAGLLVIDKRYEKAQEVLIRINQQFLSSQQMDDFRLYYGETLLALGANEASLNQLLSVLSPSSKTIEWQVRYTQALADSYLANGNYFEAAKLRINLDDLIHESDVLAHNHEKIWFSLNQLNSDFVKQLITDFNSPRLNGWLEIIHINHQWGHHPERLMQEIEQWKNRYPNHPSQINQPETLQRASKAVTYAPRQIAVLLPLSGKNAVIGNLIHDGIVAAHYRSISAQQAPILRFYDTARLLDKTSAYQTAIEEGADFILGPLTKDGIEAILRQETLEVPILTLNQIEEQQIGHRKIYQFGLPPEDEAIQSAHRAFEKGYRKAIAFLPDNSVGKRTEKAFREYFEQLGGELIDVHKYRDSRSLKTDVQKLLGVDSSTKRRKDLQQLLGRNLEFEMRRRKDADFIFMIASPTMGRMIKPFINYYFAYDLPVIATSRIYSGKHEPQTNIDLNGVEFSDAPLLLSELPLFTQSREFLAEIQPQALDARGRYFALGYDSYNILPQLSIMQSFPEYHWNGLTGELGVDQTGLVHRYLTWAKFEKGIAITTKERQIRLLEDNVSTNESESNDSVTDSE